MTHKRHDTVFFFDYGFGFAFGLGFELIRFEHELLVLDQVLLVESRWLVSVFPANTDETRDVMFSFWRIVHDQRRTQRLRQFAPVERKQLACTGTSRPKRGPGPPVGFIGNE